MLQQSAATFKIQDDCADYARRVSSSFALPLTRKRGLIEILGVACAAAFFSQLGHKVTTSRSLHKISEIFDDFKITDFYVNNRRLDAITVFNDNKIRIPKAHLTYDCAPDYYVIVALSMRIKDAKIIGFVEPEVLKSSRCEGEFIIIKESDIKDIYELNQILKTNVPQKPVYGKHLDCIALFLRYIDRELSSAYKKALIKHLITCPACTRKLVDVLRFNRAMHEFPDIEEAIKNNSAKAKALEEEMQGANEMYKELSLPQNENLVSVKDEIEVEENTEEEFEEEDFDDVNDVQSKFKNIIDTIFTTAANFDPARFSALVGTKKKRILITGVCVFVFLFFIVLISVKSSTSNISSIQDVDENYSQDVDYQSDAQERFTSAHGVPKDVYYQADGVDYSLVGATTGEPVVATINKVSWEVPENLANKANYKRFLQLAGKNIKLNLQNDLLLSSDFAKNNVIKLSIRIASNGEIVGMTILQSSGSEPIDAIIKKSVMETLTFMKPPSHGLIARPVDATLIISL